jgi:uncharacterized protein YwlG (UPF0340 family)
MDIIDEAVRNGRFVGDTSIGMDIIDEVEWPLCWRYQYRDGPVQNSDIIDKTVKNGDFVGDTSIGMDLFKIVLSLTKLLRMTIAL